MGRKRKRSAHKAEPLEGQAEREMAGGEVEEEEEEGDADDSATNPPPAAAAAAAADESEEEGDIKGLLEPFTRDELLDLLAEACLRDPALLSRLAASAASDAAHRRLFVHGLGPGATSAALAAAFAPYGDLDECHSVTDRATSRCRGYGFVTFRRRSAACCALADASKRVNGRPVACQLASLGPAGFSPGPTDRKLFVDKVPARASHDDLRRFFSEFGEIEAGPLGADRATGQFRGYAVFLYKSPDGLTKVLEEPMKVFDGCELHCRRAHRVTKKRCATTTPADTCEQSNIAAVSSLPIVNPKELALTFAKQPVVGPNPQTAEGIFSATVLFCQNARAGVAGVLGPPPPSMVMPSLPGHRTPCHHPEDFKSSRLSFMGKGRTKTKSQDPFCNSFFIVPAKIKQSG